MKKKLVIIDFQTDFCDTKVGALASAHAEAACDRFVPYLKEHYKEYDQIVYTLDTHYVDTYMDTVEGKNLPVYHCIKGTFGHELRKDLKEVVAEIKNAGHNIMGVEKSSFGRPDWNNIMPLGYERDTQVDIVGCATDICVISNAAVIKAYYPNATINILKDYCGGITEEDHNRALEAMKRIHINIV